MLPNPAWPLRLKPLTLAEFKAWLSRCVIIIPGPHVSVPCTCALRVSVYKKWRTKSYPSRLGIRIAQISLVPRRSRPPGERPSGVLNELSRHRHLSPLEFQRVQSDCSFQTFRKVAMTLFDKSVILLVSLIN